mmetsp:Transcript_102742/g.294844  ORF Transcript_102742/g.294844 Transcript_102742/m.294844 type:complete len:319 (+) Transcript_102742:70-1026(+)
MADVPSGGPSPFAQTRTETEKKQIAAALGLLQRLPPKDLEANIQTFTKIAPHLEQTLEPYVSRPLQVKRDSEQNRYFVACECNCDGGSHRSPWSGKYFPAPAGGDAEEEKLARPSERLRILEESFNEVFDAYKTGYYEGGVSSVYLWDMDEGFGGAFLIHKELPVIPSTNSGVWDAIHVVEVRESASQTNLTEYMLTTSVRTYLQVVDASKSDTSLDAWVTRTVESRSSRGKKAMGDDIHLLHIGRMIEEMEISIRQSLDSVYVAKQREVLHSCRLPEDPDEDDGVSGAAKAGAENVPNAAEAAAAAAASSPTKEQEN